MKFFILFLALFFTLPLYSQSKNIWLSPQEAAALPISGVAWTAMKAEADKAVGTPDLSDQDEVENIRTLARALVWLRSGTTAYKDKVAATLGRVPETENGGRTLSLGRKLGAYVIAADVINYRPAAFVSWLNAVRFETLDGSTLVKKHETKANNWSQSCGFSRVIADIYLGDNTDLVKAINVFKGTLGDRAAYTFPADAFGDDLSWQPDPSHPLVVLGVGAMIDGKIMSGALPEELRRAGSFKWPPPCENYVWSALEGVVGTAWVVGRLPNQDAWNWQDKAVLRAFTWQHQQAHCTATGNDQHQPWVVNAISGSNFPVVSPAQSGKLFGFGDWFAKPGVVPPPIPADFQATWQFNFDAATVKWNCHRIQNTENVGGKGATPDAAILDWIARNPGELP